MTDFKADFVSLDEFISANKKRPILLAVQPTRFALLKDPADLRKWEAMLKERIGESVAFPTDTATESADVSASGNLVTGDPDTD